MKRGMVLLMALASCGEAVPPGADPFDKGSLDLPRRWLGERPARAYCFSSDSKRASACRINPARSFSHAAWMSAL